MESLREVTTYKPESLANITKNFEDYLLVMWDEASTQQSLAQPLATQQGKIKQMTVKNIHQILPKGVNYKNSEGKSAFRNL
jgi:hypothetical protein